VPSGGIFAILCRCAMLRSCWRSVVSTSTKPVWRWVQYYGPELEQRLRQHLKPTNKSWRVDETYVRVRGRWCYLYRAIDSTGATIGRRGRLPGDESDHFLRSRTDDSELCTYPGRRFPYRNPCLSGNTGDKTLRSSLVSGSAQVYGHQHSDQNCIRGWADQSSQGRS
jgi:hypothetical protein